MTKHKSNASPITLVVVWCVSAALCAFYKGNYTHGIGEAEPHLDANQAKIILVHTASTRGFPVHSARPCPRTPHPASQAHA